MIVKKMKNKTGGKCTAQNFKRLIKYILKDKKVAHSCNINMLSDAQQEQWQAVAAEHIALASENTKTTNPVMHYMLAVKQYEEKILYENYQKIAEQFLKELGAKDLSATVAVHKDGSHPHMHIVINRVYENEQGKFRAKDLGKDVLKAHRAIARIEKSFGLEVCENAVFRENGEYNKDRVRNLSAGAKEIERTKGPNSSAESQAKALAPLFLSVKSWQELHIELGKKGLQFGKKGQGAVLLFDEKTAVKASTIDRECSLKSLEKRLGPFQAPPNSKEKFITIYNDREFTPDEQQNFTKIYENSSSRKDFHNKFKIATRLTYDDAGHFISEAGERIKAPVQHEKMLEKLGTYESIGAYYKNKVKYSTVKNPYFVDPNVEKQSPTTTRNRTQGQQQPQGEIKGQPQNKGKGLSFKSEEDKKRYEQKLNKVKEIEAVFKNARNWNELQALLATNGMKYERSTSASGNKYGSIRIYGQGSVFANSVSKEANLKVLERRFNGPFVASPWPLKKPRQPELFTKETDLAQMVLALLLLFLFGKADGKMITQQNLNKYMELREKEQDQLKKLASLQKFVKEVEQEPETAKQKLLQAIEKFNLNAEREESFIKPLNMEPHVGDIRSSFEQFHACTQAELYRTKFIFDNEKLKKNNDLAFVLGQKEYNDQGSKTGFIGLTYEETQAKMKVIENRNNEASRGTLTLALAKDKFFIMIDDISPENLKKIEQYEPCLLLETSPNSYQALLRIDYENIDHTTASKAADAISTHINKELGDPAVKTARQNVRFPGTYNHKEKHLNNFESPTTKLYPQEDRQSRKAQEMYRILVQNPERTPEYAEYAASTSFIYKEGDKAIYELYSLHAEEIRKANPNIQNWALDYNIVQRLIATGHNEQAIQEIMKQAVPMHRPDTSKNWSDNNHIDTVLKGARANNNEFQQAYRAKIREWKKLEIQIMQYGKTAAQAKLDEELYREQQKQRRKERQHERERERSR